MKMGTVCVHVYNGSHRKRFIYNTQIHTDEAPNKQTNKHIQQLLTLAKTSIIYTNTCMHKCNYPLHVKKKEIYLIERDTCHN